MAHRRIIWTRRVLTDITQEGFQTFVPDGSRNIITRPVRTTMPGTPERMPTFEHQPVTSTWVPLTPPSLGTRSRSKSVSPKDYVLSDSTPSTSNRFVGPRKRLMLNANEISPKKYKLELGTKCSTLTALHGLSNDQLVSLIETLVSDSKELEQKLQQVFPDADLKPIEKELKYLRSCIIKSMPHGNRNSRLVSRTDAVAFSRAQIHLINFKRYLVTSGSRINKSQQWSILIDFVFMAWPLVVRLITWDKPCHNDIKTKCFKFLSHQLAQAIQKGAYSTVQLEKLLDQVLILVVDSGEMKICEDLLQDKISES